MSLDFIIGLQPEMRNEIRPTSNSFISGGSILEQL
ncbi:MAG: hypothetical protein KatS3mg068_2132 [Candidatus Sericytochromatia bacterium]|nr:MAG: hypothetical protein KatS3mg068_2132 [Candidatus Sericytochromatia bacterium]